MLRRVLVVAFASFSSVSCFTIALNTCEPRHRHHLLLQPKPAMASAGTDTDASATADTANTNANSADSAALSFLRLAGQLKGVKRTGWVYRGVEDAGARVESVADHSWRMAAAAFLLTGATVEHSDDGKPLPPDDVGSTAGGQGGLERRVYDVSKVVKLAVLHDMAEAITGDIAPADNVSKEEKHRLEEAAMAKLVEKMAGFTQGGAQEVRGLFDEYEARSSPEAIACKDLDLLEMVVQADKYEAETGLDLGDFFKTVEGKFKTGVVRRWAARLVEERQARLTAERSEEDGEGKEEGSPKKRRKVG